MSRKRWMHHLFEDATSSHVGDGASTFLWTDRWLPQGRVKDLAPNLFANVPKRTIKTRLVRDGLNGGWMVDVPPDLNAATLRDFQVGRMLRSDHACGRGGGHLQVELGNE